MGSYYLDTSALVKRYIAEPGHTWIARLCRTSTGHDIYVSQVALAEAVAALSRMVREHPPRLDLRKRDRQVARFDADYAHQYIHMPVSDSVFRRAATLCRTHPLRAYDAVQLACALMVRDEAVAAGIAAPTFVCADTALLEIAKAEGLVIENPNTHP